MTEGPIDCFRDATAAARECCGGDIWIDGRTVERIPYEGKQDLKTAYRLFLAGGFEAICDCAYFLGSLVEAHLLGSGIHRRT